MRCESEAVNSTLPLTPETHSRTMSKWFILCVRINRRNSEIHGGKKIKFFFFFTEH